MRKNNTLDERCEHKYYFYTFLNTVCRYVEPEIHVSLTFRAPRRFFIDILSLPPVT